MNSNFRKILQASISQGDASFGTTAGIQCATMGLMSICYNHLKKCSYWKANDLDEILQLGDALFKDIGLFRYLGAEDLPLTVNIFSQTMQLRLQNIITGQIEGRFLVSLEHQLSQINADNSGSLLLIQNYTFAVMFAGKYIYFFDSHSRDKEGSPSDDGTAILIQFEKLSDVESYISTQYCIGSPHESIFYQLQPIKILMSECAKDAAYLSFEE